MTDDQDKAFWRGFRFLSLALSAFVFVMIVHGIYSWATGTLTWVGFWK